MTLTQLSVFPSQPNSNQQIVAEATAQFPAKPGQRLILVFGNTVVIVPDELTDEADIDAHVASVFSNDHKALKANQPRRHYVASRRADDVRTGTPSRDTRREEWIERARAVTIEAEVNRRGLRLLRQGHEFVGPCPVCREGTDRFSINPKENVWFCRRCDRGGGDALSLVEFLDGLDLKIAKDFTWACQTLTGEAPPSAGDETTAQISAKRGNSKYPGKPIVVERFNYVDESDRLLYQVQRVEFEGPDGERILKGGKRHKIFWQRRSDPNRPGEFTNGIEGVRLVPFRLPELLEDLAAERAIFIAEGERKVNLLQSWDIPATCNSGGGKKWKPELSEFFKGADIVLLGDNDLTGGEHVDTVAAALIAVGARVRVLGLPGLGPKQDIVDWAAAGGTAEQMHELAEREARP